MKTVKTKGSGKPGKTAAAGIAAMDRGDSASRYKPTEQEIREKAQAIYLERLQRGEGGTAIDDWFKAEEILRHSRQ
jgi:hypothetical protein